MPRQRRATPVAGRGPVTRPVTNSAMMVERWPRTGLLFPGHEGPGQNRGMGMSTIGGWTAPGFEEVRQAFEANFDRGSEVGAAFGAYHRGRKVVDLWGGIAD